MQGIFDPRWVTHFRPTVATAELATVRITRGVAQGYLDPILGWVEPSANVVYEGKARWQKIGMSTKRDNVSDFALFNRVRVQISFNRMPDDFTGFMPNDKVELVHNGSNPVSEGSAVYYWGDPTSSNAWHHTLNCQQNQKQDG